MPAPAPGSDAAYLEAAARIIFMGGLNRGVVDNKWPGFRAAFDGFDVRAVAAMGPADVDRLAGDDRVIRHRGKLQALVDNAGAMAELAEEHGSFGAWVDGLVARDGLAGARRELARRFAHVSEQGALFWLFATGHDVGEVSDKNRAKYAPFAG